MAGRSHAPLAALYVLLLISGQLQLTAANRNFFLPLHGLAIATSSPAAAAPTHPHELDHACVVAHLKPVANSLKLLTLFYTSMLVAQAKPPASAIVGAVMLSNSRYGAPTSGMAWQAHLAAVGNAATAAFKQCRVSPPSSTSASGLSITVAHHPGITMSIGTHGRHLLELPLWGKVLMAGTGIALAAAVIVATDGLATAAVAPFAIEMGELAACSVEAMGLGFASEAAAVAEVGTAALGEYAATYQVMDSLFSAVKMSVEAAVESLDIGDKEEREEAVKWAEFGGSATFFVKDLKDAITKGELPEPKKWVELGKQMGEEVSLATDLSDTLRYGIKAGTASAKVGESKELEVDAFSPNAPQQARGLLDIVASNRRAKQVTRVSKVLPARSAGPTSTRAGATTQARAACTNLVTRNDGCLSGERVWCCAGVISTRQLQGPCTFLGPPGTTHSCPPSGTPMRYCCPFWQNPGGASAPTIPAPSNKARTSAYKVGSSAYELCPCKPPCNAPVSGGWGVRMANTGDCVNRFDSYPCPTGMKCTPGKPSPGQAPSNTFATCV